jgi:hypothetical protein
MIKTEQEYDLAFEIKRRMGTEVKFDNGCSMDLREKEGLFKGGTPSGNNWACKADDNFIDNAIAWIKCYPKENNINI